MKKLIKSALFTMILLMVTLTPMVSANSVFPSTNDANRDNGWAHVNVVSSDYGEVTLEFVSTRDFYSCFEYRTDGDTSQKISDTNYNPEITDGLYPYICISNSTRTETFTANEYVEIRLSFGAESDERFDWTRFDVLTPPVPEEKDQCKLDGWMSFYYPDGTPFINQGQCIQFVLTGK